MDYALAISPDLKIDAEEFASAWNKDSKSKGMAQASAVGAAKESYPFIDPAMIHQGLIFLAGVAGMTYRKFLSYNLIGGVLWISLLVYAGYLFGNIPWVKQNLSLIVLGIVFVSLLPAITTYVRERRSRH